MKESKLSQLSSAHAVRSAMAEFDRLGRDGFLKKYGYGRSHRYFLRQDGKDYDSKAIVGAAYGYQFPDRGPMLSSEFSGGERTVRRKLEELGFDLFVLPPSDAWKKGGVDGGPSA
jgi:putative restriction endonuclease